VSQRVHRRHSLVRPQPGPLVHLASTLAGMFDRIVVGYNDSPMARRALNIALQLARIHGSELIAIAVEAHLAALRRHRR
jgi:hypothetical protein